MGDKVGNSVGWFDGFSVVREIVGDTVGLSVASLASGDIDIDINILKKRFRGSTSCIDIGILKKRFRVSTSCSKKKKSNKKAIAQCERDNCSEIHYGTCSNIREPITIYQYVRVLNGVSYEVLLVQSQTTKQNKTKQNKTKQDKTKQEGVYVPRAHAPIRYQSRDGYGLGVLICPA